MSRARSAGFTLIELLVVIAIIAILAAILFPVFAQAREKARTTACLSQAKQMGTALDMYTQDYDESLPRLWTCCPARDWTTDLLPYIRTGSLADAARINAALAKDRLDLFTAAQPFYQCPSKGPSRDPRGFRRGYGYNGYLAGDQPLRLAAIPAPSETLAFGDVYGEVDRLYPYAAPIGDDRFYPEARHGGGLNTTFADGHARWINGTDARLQWPKGLAASKLPTGTLFWPQ